MAMKRSMDAEKAQTLALMALGYIVANDKPRDTLLTQTGLDGAALKAQAADPVFLAGVLDFLTRHEDFLLGFEEESGVHPDQISVALHALGGVTQ